MKSVLVVGGGVIGLFSAYYAMQRGHRVTVVERGSPSHDCCSLGNAGLIVPSHFVPLAAPGMVGLGLKMLANPHGPFAIRPRIDAELARWCIEFARACAGSRAALAEPVLRDLSLASKACYESLATEPGLEFGLVQRGLLMLCRSPKALEHEIALAARARALGIDAEALNPEQAARLDPGMRMDIAGAVYFPQDCHLNPGMLMAGLTRELEVQGVQFLWNTEVTGGMARGRCLNHLDSTNGALTADEFVIAGGSWSSRLARSLGVRIPLQAGKGYSITLPAPRAVPLLPSLLTEARVAVTPMSGALRFAGTMEIAGLQTTIDLRRVDGIRRAAVRYFPDLSPSDFESVPVWSGLRPCSPDGLPYIGRFRSFDNLSVATGHSMLGVSLAPITGKLIAEVLSDERPTIATELLDPNRYI